MATYPTLGSAPWNLTLKAYIDDSIAEAAVGGPWAPLVHTHDSGDITDFEDAVLAITGGGPSVELPFYYPETYGAQGDGTTNDAAALQAAIDAAYSAGGGFVQLGKSKRYRIDSKVVVRNAVMLLGQGGRQNLTPSEATTQPGIVAGAAGAQLCIGDWDFGGAAKPGGVRELYVDGNYVGGETGVVAKRGLVRLAGVDVMINGLYTSRSAGDGTVLDGLQNSTIIGGMSTLHAGLALAYDNGPGAVAMHGGYYGTSGGGVFACRDIAGEANVYPFGATQCTWHGTIFEAYNSIAATYPEAPLDLPYPFHVRISGRNLKFTGCNFTAGATNDADCAVLVDASASIIAPSIVFDSCMYWVLGGKDSVRVASAAQLAFIGQNETVDDGTNHGASFLCIDTGTPQVSLGGPIIFNGDVNGDKSIRTINGGSLLATFTIRDGGDTYRLRTGQALAVRPQGSPANSVQIEPNGLIRWMDPATGTTHASIQRSTVGGNGLTASGRMIIFNSLVTYPVQQSINGVGVSATIDSITSSEHRLAFTNNSTLTSLTITNAFDGAQLRIGLFGTGTNAITWPASILFNGGSGPQPSNGTAVYVDLTYHAALSKWVEVSRSTGGVGPAGPAGANGTAATIAPGTVTTLEEDQPATVTNSGTSSAAVFDFGLPRGGRGIEGPPGPLGNQVEQNIVAANATYTLDPYYGTDYTITLLNQTTAFTAANLSNGATMTLNVVEDGTGGWAFTFPSNWIGAADLVPDTGANKINTFAIWKSPLGYHIQQVYKGTKPAGIWTPNDLDNKIAWFNANSIPVDEGDTITTWVNDWVAGQALTIAGAPKLHIGGGNNKFAQFDGIADSAAVTHTPSVANPYTYAALVQTATNVPVIGGANAAAFDIYTSGGNWRMHAGAEVTASVNTGLWTVVVAAIQTPSTSDYMRIDGTVTTGNASNTKTGKYTQLFKNNAGAFGAGKIAQLIKVNDLLTSPELVNIESYLGAIRDQLNGV